MKVTIDQSKCQGHALCGVTAPDVFDYDDEGFAIAPDGDISAELEASARQAAMACPESAISLT
jgi:ferredoxin